MGRSTYSGTAWSALAFQDDHGYHALGPRLVVRERGPDLRHLLIQSVALGTAFDRTGLGLELLGPAGGRHLDLDLRIGFDVSEPCRMLRRPALRCADDVVVPLQTADQRGGDRLSALGPRCRHEQHMVAPQSDAPSRLAG